MMRVALLSIAVVACALPEDDLHAVRWFDYAHFAAEIQPILADGCGNPSCHGRPERPLSIYSVGNWRLDPDMTHRPDPLTLEELRHNYTVSCVLATDADAPEQALLVRKPLADRAGVYHGGGIIFEGTTDRDYRAVLAWLREGWE